MLLPMPCMLWRIGLHEAQITSQDLIGVSADQDIEDACFRCSEHHADGWAASRGHHALHAAVILPA